MNSYQNIHFFSKTTWVPFRRLLSSRFFSSKIHYLFNIVLIFPILLVTLFWKISPKSFTNMLSNSSNIKSKIGASAWKKKTNMTEKCLQWRKKETCIVQMNLYILYKTMKLQVITGFPGRMGPLQLYFFQMLVLMVFLVNKFYIYNLSKIFNGFVQNTATN